MNYCPNCGRRLDENDEYCSACGFKIPSDNEPAQPAVNLKKNVNENGQEYSEAGESQAQFAMHKETAAHAEQGSGFNEPGGFRRETEEPFSNGLKVLFVAINLLVPVIGFIFGVISAIIFMRKKNQDYKSFGKALLVLNIILLALYLFCCVFSGFNSGFKRGFIKSFEDKLRERGYYIERYDDYYEDYTDGEYRIF